MQHVVYFSNLMVMYQPPWHLHGHWVPHQTPHQLCHKPYLTLTLTCHQASWVLPSLARCSKHLRWMPMFWVRLTPVCMTMRMPRKRMCLHHHTTNITPSLLYCCGFPSSKLTASFSIAAHVICINKLYTFIMVFTYPQFPESCYVMAFKKVDNNLCIWHVRNRKICSNGPESVALVLQSSGIILTLPNGALALRRTLLMCPYMALYLL